ncbi:MAG: FdtA/QdtA family cupin domain-containing protein [Bacteroidaceae bacterium]|nr:FdtA/QdtA family cupin domain-containing protein [Bacteroidaceae bacterium]
MKAKLVQLPKITDPTRGSLTFVQNSDEFPFEIKRAYWTYDVPAGEWRGGHAHKKLKQLILAVSGCFTLKLDDGKEKKEFLLKNPFQAVLIEEGIWRELHDFSAGAVCMVLASEEFDEEDYIRDYDEFIEWTRGN